MPEHLRALAVILVFAIAVFTLAGAPARAMAAAAGEFERRRNLWIGITLAAFFAHNFWLFMLLAGIMLHIASARDQNKIGLVLFVLLAVPPFSSEIPGFGGVRYLFDMNYVRLISLVVLLPALVREAARHSGRYFFTETADRLFYLFIILNVILMVRADITTAAVRSAFLLFIDAVLFYAIASRSAQDNSVFRSVFSGYVTGAAVLAFVGVFEFSRDWLLYSSLDEALGAERGSGNYLRRGESLRAMGTAGHAIPYGYAMAVGLMLLLGLRRHFPRQIVWWAGIGILVMGLVSAYSRGPWVGALAGFVVFCLTGPHKWKNFAHLALFSMVLFAVLIATPLGEALLYRAATVDTGTFDYRERVFWNAIEIISANPFFGSDNFMFTAAMQELIQGQGIIDIVNTYVAVPLRSGLVGLLLFAGFFLSALAGAWRRMNSASEKNSEAVDIGRGLLAALTCILVTIATVSSISIIPTIYYAFAGLAVAYARSGREKTQGNAAA